VADLLYHLNARDEITSVNEEWLAFARVNEGGYLLPPHILGRSLWEFIADPGTRHIYRQLHDRVRSRGEPARLSLRCDSPDRRRLLELNIAPSAHGDLSYQVRTIEEEERLPVPLLDSTQPRSERLVRMCSWCKRVSAGPRGWLELEEAVAALALFEESRLPQLTHGICSDCSRNLGKILSDDPDEPLSIPSADSSVSSYEVTNGGSGS
jgi:hypothetical protein